MARNNQRVYGRKLEEIVETKKKWRKYATNNSVVLWSVVCIPIDIVNFVYGKAKI